MLLQNMCLNIEQFLSKLSKGKCFDMIRCNIYYSYQCYSFYSVILSYYS